MKLNIHYVDVLCIIIYKASAPVLFWNQKIPNSFMVSGIHNLKHGNPTQPHSVLQKLRREIYYY